MTTRAGVGVGVWSQTNLPGDQRADPDPDPNPTLTLTLTLNPTLTLTLTRLPTLCALGLLLYGAEVGGRHGGRRRGLEVKIRRVSGGPTRPPALYNCVTCDVRVK